MGLGPSIVYAVSTPYHADFFRRGPGKMMGQGPSYGLGVAPSRCVLLDLAFLFSFAKKLILS
jgi:hypothetical protein